MYCRTIFWCFMQGNLIGAGREGSNLLIFDIEKCFIEKNGVSYIEIHLYSRQVFNRGRVIIIQLPNLARSSKVRPYLKLCIFKHQCKWHFYSDIALLFVLNFHSKRELHDKLRSSSVSWGSCNEYIVIFTFFLFIPRIFS